MDNNGDSIVRALFFLSITRACKFLSRCCELCDIGNLVNTPVSNNKLVGTFEINIGFTKALCSNFMVKQITILTHLNFARVIFKRF